MCGIAGFLKPGARESRDVLERMCDRLAHRGPDAYGWLADDEAALGHRRLSIIDLSTGDQPMGNEDGSIQVVFNGEIYNYRELRAELQAKGHRFRSESDTEVLAHLYEEAGERMPEFLNGMFAFAIWDAPRQRLFVARDRMGKKPLYYTSAVPGYRFAFASELKALAAMPGFDARVDERSVAEFLALSYVPDPRTIYRSAAKLEAAHSLTVDREGIRTRRYWAPPFQQRGQRREDAMEELSSLAEDAVSRRMISDVPLGAFLSGGVDSSAAVAYMSRQATGAVRTFSIGFTNKRFDELDHARVVAEMYRTEHHEKTVSPRIEDVLDSLGHYMDEPFGDPSIIPTLYLAQMTRQHVTVALSGDGADEVFGGYRRYYYGVLEENLRRKFPGSFRRSAVAWAGRHYPKFDYLPQVFRAKSLLTNLSLEIGDAYYSSMTAFRDDGLNAVLAPEVRRALGGYAPRDWFRDQFTAVRHLHPLEQMQTVDFQTYLPGDILVKADRASMIHSLEARAPWLDYRIVEFACGLPPAWKLDGRVGKAIFKKVVAPLLPKGNVSRKKMGFVVPLAEWFRTSLKPVFESMVLGKDAEAIISPVEARRLWAQHQSSVFNHERKLWNLLMLAMWQAGRHAGTESAVGAAQSVYMREFLLLGVIVGLAIAAMFRPKIGIYSMVWFALARPDATAWSTGAYPYASILELGSLIGAMKMLHQLPALWGNTAFRLYLALLVPIMLSVAFAIHPTLCYTYLWWYVSSVSCAVLIPLVIQTEEEFRVLFVVFALSIGYLGSRFGLYGVLRGGVRYSGGFAGGYSDNNTLGLAFTMGIPVCWFARNLVKWFPVRLGLVVATFLTIAAVVFTHSRGAAISLIVAFLVILVHSKHRILMLVAFVVLTGPSVYLVRDTYFDRMETMKDTETAQQDESIMDRVEASQVAMRMWRDYPILGVGFGSMNEQQLFRLYTDPGSSSGKRVIHDTYLQMLVDSGTFALVAYVVFLFGTIILLERSCRRLKRAGSMLYQCPLALEASLVAFAVGSVGLTRITDDVLYITLMASVSWLIVEPRYLESLELEESDAAEDGAQLQEAEA